MEYILWIINWICGLRTEAQILLALLLLFFMVLVYVGIKRNGPTDTVVGVKAAYVGMEMQQRRNKRATVRMFILYPLFAALISGVLSIFVNNWTWGAIMLAVFAVWYAVSYSSYAKTIAGMTESRSVERYENPRIYNLLENLCIAGGMVKTPRLCVMEEKTLNAFASGINENDYTVTLTTGIINKLNDEELEGVMAHELSHIRNGDVKIMTLSLVFNGIYRMLPIIVGRIFLRPLLRGGRRRGGGKGKGALGILAVAAALWILTTLINGIATLMHFAISRKREFIADAAAAQLTGKPWALANALKKISGNDYIENIDNEDLAGMFISNPCCDMSLNKDNSGETRRPFSLSGLTATHPDIRLRIEVLEQFEMRSADTSKTIVFK